MKIPKQINIKTTLIFIAITVIATSAIFYVFAAIPTSTYTVTGGIYPGAPSYTVWREGSIYFTKDANGNQKYDSTNASQILNNVIAASTSEVFVKGGIYVIDSTIVVDHDILIRGEGNQTVFELDADVNLFNVTSSNVKFYDFYADGNSYEADAFYAQSDSGLINCMWQNLRIKAFKGRGIFIGSPTAGNSWIMGCRITLCDQAIVLGSVANMYVVGNDFGACTYSVVTLGGAHNLFEGNTVYMAGYNWSGDLSYHAYRGIDIYHSHYMLVVGNYVFSNGGDGILLNSGNYSVIDANYVNENDRANDNRAGIRLYANSSFNNIVGNTVNNVGGSASQNYGIHEESGDHNNIVGCNAWNQLTAGILISGDNTEVMSSWNGTTYIGGGEAGPAGPPGGLEGAQPYSYLIFENATSKYLQDGSDGSIITNNADASVLVQYVVDNYETWWLHFTDGTFECNTQVNFGTETYFMISGSGWSTILELNSNLGTTTDFWEFDYTALSHGRFIIRDLYFDMQGDTYTSRDCISIVGGERWKLENIKILMPYRDGLNIDETGGSGYTRYNTVESFQVYYAGRYGVYCDGRDNNFIDIQIEYSYDTCFVFDTAGVGNSLFRLHATGAHNTGEYYGSGAGGGLSRYAGLEIRGTVGGGNTCHGVYLDRCNKTGVYITGSNNALMGGRVYECNYQAASSAYADVYIDGDYNRVVGMELNGQSSNPTNYGVHLDTGSNNCAVTSNIGRDHAIAHFQNDGTSNEVAHNA